jgi:hypothetical protein
MLTRLADLPRAVAAKLYTVAFPRTDWEPEARSLRDKCRDWVGDCVSADSARKLAFAGIVVNIIAVGFPIVGTIAQFLKIGPLLIALGLDASSGLIITIVLFGAYVTAGIIAPAIALQTGRARQSYAVPLMVLVGGVITIFSVGGFLLILAAALLISAGPDEAYGLAQSSEAHAAEALRDQMSPPRPAYSCPICGTPLGPDQHTCPACAARTRVGH